jgi:hypothetical protein
MNAEVDVFPAKHTWKHIHLGIYMETGGCDCSLKELLMMGIIRPKTQCLQTNKPTTSGNTSTSAFIRKPEAVTAV